jgi:hypothetical protein
VTTTRILAGRRCATLVGIFLTLLVGACADTRYAVDYVDSGAAARQRVAVVPLENLTNFPQAGIIVGELIASELYRRQLFDLTEGTALRKALGALDIELADLAESFGAAELAGRLGVDAVLVGSVSEYGYQHGLHEEPVVGVNLRLVGVDGQVLWAASHSTTGRGYIARDSVNAAAQRLVGEMVGVLQNRVGAP